MDSRTGRSLFAGIGALLVLVGGLVAWPVLDGLFRDHPAAPLRGTIGAMALAIAALGLGMLATGLTADSARGHTVHTGSGVETSVSVTSSSSLPAYVLGGAAVAILVVVLLNVDAFRASTPIAVGVALLVGWWSVQGWRRARRAASDA